MLGAMRARGDGGEAARLPSGALFAVAFGVAALVPALVFRGFMVDDALITARYAAHLAAGEGYRLNAGGPVTDGVTPLGFAFLLAPFARGGPLAALAAAKGARDPRVDPGERGPRPRGAARDRRGSRPCGARRSGIIEAWPRRRGRDRKRGRPAGSVAIATMERGRIGVAIAERDLGLRGRTGSRGLGVAAAMVPFVVIATSAPLGAWAASGLETGIVAALGALAVALPFLRWPLAGMACAGIAAGLRPELLPWAAMLGIGCWFAARSPSQHGERSSSRWPVSLTLAGRPRFPRERREGADPEGPADRAGASMDVGVRAEEAPPQRADDRVTKKLGEEAFRARLWIAPLLVVAPFGVVALVRLAVFGRPAPLSIFAKAPDARLGLYYAVACALLAGPVVIAAPWAFLRLPRFERAVVASVVVHLVAIGLAGGDWMPLSRLLVPVLPSIAMAGLLLAQRAALPATFVRVALAVAGQTFVLVHVGPTAARVGADRMRVIEELRPALLGSHAIASLDIGWVGASTDAALVDLAGVTDPRIAALPGGHTTKQIPVGLLDARGVDTLVLLLAPGARVAEPWTRSRFARGVEAWIATTPGVGDTYAPVAESSLPHLRYVVLRRGGSSAPPPGGAIDRHRPRW